jgi:hypothetical protein
VLGLTLKRHAEEIPGASINAFAQVPNVVVSTWVSVSAHLVTSNLATVPVDRLDMTSASGSRRVPQTFRQAGGPEMVIAIVLAHQP